MKQLFSLLILGFCLASCEKPILSDEETFEPEGNVTLRFTSYTQQSFTRAAISECFNKLNLMLFDENNEKILSQIKTQNVDDSNFGTFSFNLSAGTYKVVAIGHSSSKSCSITSLEKVTFTAVDGRKNTDTFYYYGTIEVSEEPQTYNNQMVRGTAMFRLVLTDENMPEAVKKLQIKYTGGSADINPVTGLGCTNSTQNESREVSSDNIYEVYTFPKATTGKLKVTVSALDANGDVLKQRVFEDVPVTANVITQYKGQFFDSSDGTITSSSIGFTADPTWQQTDEYTF